MTIKEAKEIACEAIADAAEEAKDGSNIEAVSDCILLRVNCALKDSGYVCLPNHNANGSIKIDLYKKECTVGAVYAKKKIHDPYMGLDCLALEEAAK